jgi:hypothetical protein
MVKNSGSKRSTFRLCAHERAPFCSVRCCCPISSLCKTLYQIPHRNLRILSNSWGQNKQLFVFTLTGVTSIDGYQSIALSVGLASGLTLFVLIFYTLCEKERINSDNFAQKYFSKVRCVHAQGCCVVGFSCELHIWNLQKKWHFTSKRTDRIGQLFENPAPCMSGRRSGSKSGPILDRLVFQRWSRLWLKRWWQNFIFAL